MVPRRDFLLGLGAAPLALAAAVPHRTPTADDDAVVHDYGYYTNYEGMNELILAVNKNVVPNGWRINTVLVTRPGKQLLWHALLERPRDNPKPPENLSAAKYGFRSNYDGLNELVQVVNKNDVPAGDQLALVMVTEPWNTPLWHAVIYTPPAEAVVYEYGFFSDFMNMSELMSRVTRSVASGWQVWDMYVTGPAGRQNQAWHALMRRPRGS